MFSVVPQPAEGRTIEEPSASPEASPPLRWRSHLIIVLAVLLMVVGLVVVIFVGWVFHGIMQMPSGAGAMDKLREVGPEVVRQEALALLAKHEPGTKLEDGFPPGIAHLDPINVIVWREVVRIKIAGMGSWYGFVIPGEGYEVGPGEEVAPGIFWNEL